MSQLPQTSQTILFLAANPKDTGRLRLDQELRYISEGLQRSQNRDQFKLAQQWAVRPQDIRRAMLDMGPQIVHFSGHGEGESGLIFENEFGNAQLVDGAALAGLFALFSDQITCVVLNGCYSEVQAKAIAKHIPFVIGMNKAIGDRAAIAFAVGFYDALGAGRDVEFAYKLGCSAIQMEGIAEYLTPVLLKQVDSIDKATPVQPKSEQSKSDVASGGSGGMRDVLTLSNDDRKQLRKAIEEAYPDPDGLNLFVDEELNVNLATISTASNYRTVIFDLIKWAIARGHIEKLILALAKDTPNPAIQRFCSRVLSQYLTLNASDSLITEASLDLDPSTWDLDVHSEELQEFLPQQFSFEADVGQLQRGLELANSVCKITFADRPAQESGTGVLIAPGLVLTNYHVLSLKEGVDLNALARSARFEFGYVSSKFGELTRIQTLKADANEPVRAFSPIHQLDYALLRLSPEQDVLVPPVPFNTSSRLMPKSPLNILQHPEGEQMKVSLSNNGVVKTNETRGLVLYVNPTKRGSSGSPCFDNDWKLVALHHKEMATSFGSVREGILFNAIYPQIASVL